MTFNCNEISSKYGHIFVQPLFVSSLITLCPTNAKNKRALQRLISTAVSKIVSEYDQEIPKSQTADKPMTPRGRATQQSLDTKKTK